MTNSELSFVLRTHVVIFGAVSTIMFACYSAKTNNLNVYLSLYKNNFI